MKITYVMGVYKTAVAYKDAYDIMRTRVISTRSNSEQTAEAMALGKVLKENKGEWLKLVSVDTWTVKEAIND